ncbi:MAG TPA: lipopolysaccharide transport periplasmic protein LptA [Gallionella sp.]|nr:lipopolysaccharide transport periplasmic protein LptA [Gallionella sp.]
MRRTINKLLPPFLLLPALLLFWAPASFAERADRDMPINLEADQVHIDDAQKISTFTGNVRLSQGTLLIRGDRIVVIQNKDGFKHASAYGKTAEFRQKREGLEGYVEGYGERIEYDTQAETLNFYKQARLKRDQDEVSGEHITYNAKTDVFEVNGSSASSGDIPPQRVRAVLQPKQKEGTGSAPNTFYTAPGDKLAPAK